MLKKGAPQHGTFFQLKEPSALSRDDPQQHTSQDQKEAHARSNHQVGPQTERTANGTRTQLHPSNNKVDSVGGGTWELEPNSSS